MSGPLKYGMHIRLQAKSPLPGPSNVLSHKPLSVGVYAKHNLVCLGAPDQPNGLVFKVIPTGQISSEVVNFGDKVILMDPKSGKVMNYIKTGTWGQGYISLAEKKDAGELHTVFQCSGKAVGTPILLDEVNSSFRVTVSVVSAKDNKVNPTPITISKKSSSNVIGGYTMRDGSGSNIQFAISLVPDEEIPAFAPNQTGLVSAPGSPSVVNSGHNDDASRSSRAFSPAPMIASPSSLHRVNSEPHSRPSMSFSLARDSESGDPIRYGDRIKLFATTPYHTKANLPGGYVGIYKKHNLAAVGPVTLAADEPRFDECQFTVLPAPSTTSGQSSGDMKPQTGELVRYAAAIILQDQFGNVWNNKFTGTWGDGFFASAPAKPSAKLEGSGEVELSFQPSSHGLMGFPVHAGDSSVSLDVEHSYRVASKFNTRIRTYKKSSSQLRGGYLICLPSNSAAKPVTFRIELIEATTATTAGAGTVSETQTSDANVPDFAAKAKSREIAKKAKRQAREEREKKIAAHAAKMKSFERQSDEYATKIFTSTISKRSDSRLGDRTSIILNAVGAICLALAGVQFSNAYNIIGQIKASIYLIFALFSIGVVTSGILRPKSDAHAQIIPPPSPPAALVLSDDEQDVSDDEEHSDAGDSDDDADIAEIAKAQEIGKSEPDSPVDADSGVVVEVSNGFQNWEVVPLPERFIRAEKGNVESARLRFVKTMRWFDDNRLWTILDRPHPLYRFIKKNTHHFFAGRGKNGNCIYYERPKSVKINDLAKADVSYDDLLYHFVYITEYLYQRLDTDPNAKCFSVVDCTGVGMSDFTGSVANYMKKIAYITGNHYPERSFAIFCLNAPFSFRLLWNIVKGFVDPVTQEKTHIMGSKGDYLPRLRTLVDDNQIPSEYGGSLAFTPTIPESIDFPETGIEAQFNRISIKPISHDEEVLMDISDKVNMQAMLDKPGQLIERPYLLRTTADAEREHQEALQGTTTPAPTA